MRPASRAGSTSPRRRLGGLAFAAVLGLAGWLPAAPAHALAYTIDTVMTGLVTPRGLAFAPDGALYVTEVGRGGGVGAPSLGSGPRAAYLGYTGAVSRLASGVQSRVLTGLPSLANAAGAEAAGLQDIVFDPAGQAYGVFGLGSSSAARDALGAFGAGMLGTVARLGLDGSGTVSPIADIAKHETTANPDGGAIDSNPFGLARRADGSFVVTDAGGNSFVQATAAGVVTTLGVLPPETNPLPFGPPVYQSVPTGVAIGPGGNPTVGTLTGFPFPPGAAKVFAHAAGTTGVAFAGFTTIIDLDFDAAGNLYVLQISSNGLAAPGGPGTGLLIKVDGRTGQRSTIASDGLIAPGGLAIREGPRGPVFYVSNMTAGPEGGAVLRISAVPEPAGWAMGLAGLAGLGAAVRRRRARRA
ncbi:MAG: ScyD/ScyE family protein [Burkholderiales bacterium]|nr:ScyD/ScyE family protein [Burkholderiales bacterium]